MKSELFHRKILDMNKRKELELKATTSEERGSRAVSTVIDTY